MPKLRDLHLEPFSLALARKVLEAFPLWEPYVGRAVREENGLTVYLLQIEVPSANRDVREPLTILAALDGIVYASWFPISPSSRWHVGWVTYHSVRPSTDWRSDPSGFDAIVRWLRDFTEEKIVAAVWYEGERWSAGGAPRAGEVERMARKGADGLLVRSWRGTHDVDRRPDRPLPAAIVYGYPESTLGKLVAECLGSEVELRFATEHELPDTNRAILLDPEWIMALWPSETHYACSDGRSWTVRPEDQSHPRLFIVRWDGDGWSGPWEEEGSFDIRGVERDRDLLRKHLLAWLREP